MRGGGITAEDVASFLKRLDVVVSFVITSDGLPIIVEGLDEAGGEELGSVGESVIRSGLLNRLGGADSIVAVGGREYIIVKLDGGACLTAEVRRGCGYPLAQTLAPSAPRCGRCGASFRLASVKCPSCGAMLPYAVTSCPSCSRPIRFRRCPACGAVVDVNGGRVGLVERLGAGPAAEVVLARAAGKV